MIPLKDDHVAFHYYNIWLNDKQDNYGVLRILFHNHLCCDIGICPIYKKHYRFDDLWKYIFIEINRSIFLLWISHWWKQNQLVGEFFAEYLSTKRNRFIDFTLHKQQSKTLRDIYHFLFSLLAAVLLEMDFVSKKSKIFKEKSFIHFSLHKQKWKRLRKILIRFPFHY